MGLGLLSLPSPTEGGGVEGKCTYISPKIPMMVYDPSKRGQTRTTPARRLDKPFSNHHTTLEACSREVNQTKDAVASPPCWEATYLKLDP